MALSNWDTLAFDAEGNPSNGELKCPDGVSVALYKNWLYVEDAAAWRPNGGYTKPIVLEVQSGNVQYNHLRIIAVRRTYQNAIFCLTSFFSFDYEGDLPLWMIGIGCYAYDDKHEHIGVTQHTFDSFIKWLKKLDELDDTYIDSLSSKARRFNQGDAYFAAATNNMVTATPIGLQGPTLMSKLYRPIAQSPSPALGTKKQL